MLRYILFDLTLFDPYQNVWESRKDLLWILEALTQRNQNYLKEHPETPKLYRSGVRYAVPAQFQGECKEVSVLRKAVGGNSSGEVERILDSVQQVFGGERFRDIGRVIENREGDCDNLAAWRAAELRQSGIAASVTITWRQRFGGGTTYHALVRWPPIGSCRKYTHEDPSLLLGMHQPARAGDRQEEIRKNQERCDILRGTPLRDQSPDSLIEGVLGLRQPDRDVAEMVRVLRGGKSR